MNLENFEAGLDCPSCGRYECANNASDARLIQFSWRPIAFIEWGGTWCDGFPAARIERQLVAAFLRNSATPFTSCMSKLNSGHRTNAFNERGDSREHWNVIVAPNPKVAWRDAAFRRHGGCLCDHKTSAADRASSEMHQMPIIRMAIVRAVLTHRRHCDPIAKCYAAYLQ